MYWKTPFRVNKSVDSPISTIRIDVDTLREAYLEVLFFTSPSNNFGTLRR
jgi:hypothetical protein